MPPIKSKLCLSWNYLPMRKLYRGVSKELDLKCEGKLSPKGSMREIAARYDGRIRYDGTFSHGTSEDNTVRAHHIESGLYSGCYISTTYDEDLARIFATNNYKQEGWVYVLDQSLFEKYGIITKKFPDPLYPYEKEISIRAADNKSIPNQVVIEKYEVNTDGSKKT